MHLGTIGIMIMHDDSNVSSIYIVLITLLLAAFYMSLTNGWEERITWLQSLSQLEQG
jgi:hypothetical protein